MLYREPRHPLDPKIEKHRRKVVHDALVKLSRLGEGAVEELYVFDDKRERTDRLVAYQARVLKNLKALALIVVRQGVVYLAPSDEERQPAKELAAIAASDPKQLDLIWKTRGELPSYEETEVDDDPDTENVDETAPEDVGLVMGAGEHTIALRVNDEVVRRIDRERRRRGGLSRSTYVRTLLSEALTPTKSDDAPAEGRLAALDGRVEQLAHDLMHLAGDVGFVADFIRRLEQKEREAR